MQCFTVYLTFSSGALIVGADCVVTEESHARFLAYAVSLVIRRHRTCTF